jgi:hypothetical protein
MPADERSICVPKIDSFYLHSTMGTEACFVLDNTPNKSSLMTKTQDGTELLETISTVLVENRYEISRFISCSKRLWSGSFCSSP